MLRKPLLSAVATRVDVWPVTQLPNVSGVAVQYPSAAAIRAQLPALKHTARSIIARIG